MKWGEVLGVTIFMGTVALGITGLLVAIPTYFLWNWLSPVYFYWLPDIYKNIPFFHVMGLAWLVLFLKQIFLPAQKNK